MDVNSLRMGVHQGLDLRGSYLLLALCQPLGFLPGLSWLVTWCLSRQNKSSRQILAFPGSNSNYTSSSLGQPNPCDQGQPMS